MTTAQREHAEKTDSVGTVVRFFWLISLVSALAGGLAAIAMISGATGAPQEAAGAAIACVIAIVPYVFARALSELSR